MSDVMSFFGSRLSAKCLVNFFADIVFSGILFKIPPPRKYYRVPTNDSKLSQQVVVVFGGVVMV